MNTNTPQTVKFVSGNPYKQRVVESYLQTPGIKLEFVDVDLPEIQTMDLDLLALTKAKAAYKQVKAPVLVYDTSLYLDVLLNMPGPFLKFCLATPDACRRFIDICKAMNNHEARVVQVMAYYDGQNSSTVRENADMKVSTEFRTGGFFPPHGMLIPVNQPGGENKTLSEMDFVTATYYNGDQHLMEKTRTMLVNKFQD